ncbi:MAG: cytochrome P450 [Beijerinckiaceae bacterium]
MTAAFLSRSRFLSRSWRPPAPVPRSVPLGPIATLYVLRRNPIETWTQAHFEAPIVMGRSVLGNAAVVSAPAGIRRVLVDNVANYRKDALQKRVLAPGLGEGLLTVEGEAWKTQRRVLAPLFTPRTIASFALPMAHAADALVARWRRLREGQRLDIQKEMARVTLDVLQRTIFSDGLAREPEEFMAAMTRYFESVGQLDPFDLLDMPAWLPRLSRLRSRSALTFFADAVDAIVARRKHRLEVEAEAGPRDLLTLLLEAQDPETGSGLSEHEVRTNIVTFIGAGHETTANALTWTLFLLSHSEEWRTRLAREADAVLDGPVESYAEGLVETRAVVEEAMRLYPPVASLSREAIGPDDLLGRRIRMGTWIMMVPWVLHRHRLLWDNPDGFDPRRFLPGAREKIDRFAYIPFGAGPRICIGAIFALQEAVVVLAKILREFRLEHDESHVVRPVQRITLRPQGGMPMMLHRRGR